MGRETKKELRIADLFCGPGGISHGFQMAGCRVVYGMDIDRAALTTFAANHRSAVTYKGDATLLDADSIPEFDVLVGGPPCVNFSSSKGSRANILEGLRLVHIFLRLVYERKPKYWVMENVPNIAMHLPETIPLKWIGIDKAGELHVPTKGELNSADYGAPQLRRRYLIGQYPIPPATHFDATSCPLFAGVEGKNPWLTLQDVLSALPSPFMKARSGRVRDPNYDIEVPASQLGDHFYDTTFSPDEARRIREAKVDHPYMGRMPFPDELDRPSRTVVATQLGRETLVIGYRKGRSTLYRRATVRECATLQTFPITFQFHGNSLNARYRQAGDAVPPKMAFAVASEVIKAEGLVPPRNPLVERHVVELSTPASLNPRRDALNVLPLDKAFRQTIPGKEIRGCRVELDNRGAEPSQAVLMPAGCRNLVRWAARLHVGEGKAKMRDEVFSTEHAVEVLSTYCLGSATNRLTQVESFLKELETVLPPVVCDATTLQAVWTRRAKGPLGPHEVGDLLADVVNRHFPSKGYGNMKIPQHPRHGVVPTKGILIRIAAGLVATAYACRLANEGSEWVTAHPEQRHLPSEWTVAGDAVVVPMHDGLLRVFHRGLQELR